MEYNQKKLHVAVIVMHKEDKMIKSYPIIFNLGHRAIENLLTVPVIVQEKVDGNQISFGVIDRQLEIRSKDAQIYIGANNGMFNLAVEKIQEHQSQLIPNCIYRGEYLSKPKHNTLTYSRVPIDNIVLFDVQRDDESFYGGPPRGKASGFEYVPFLGMYDQESPLTMEKLEELLDRESFLGGVKIEGVVIKPALYNLFGTDKKVLMGKFVNEKYKEIQHKDWQANNPAGKDITAMIASKYCTEARWEKAIQHLRDKGELQEAPQDIGPLLKEIQLDMLKECREEMMEEVWRWAWPNIERLAVRGFPQWYKERLMMRQFGG